MATELLLNNVIGDKLFGDISTFDANDESTRIDTAMLGLFGVLDTKAGFGYKGAYEGDGTSNVTDFINLMTQTLPFAGPIFYLNNQLSPSAAVLNDGVAIVKSLPFAEEVILPMLAPATTQEYFGGSAFTALQDTPVVGDVLSIGIANLSADPLLADQAALAFDLLEDFSFGGNLIEVINDPSSAPAFMSAMFTDFAGMMPTPAGIVGMIKAGPAELEDTLSTVTEVLASYGVDLPIPTDTVFSALDPLMSAADPVLDAVINIAEILPGADDLGGLLGGTGLISGSASASSDGSSEGSASILGILTLDSTSMLNLDSLNVLA
jgi:hypothetical protein